MTTKRWFLLGGGVVLVALVVFVLVWFQPQKLFIDDRVDEAVPVVADAPSGGSVAGSDPSGPASTVPPQPDGAVASQGAEPGTAGSPGETAPAAPTTTTTTAPPQPIVLTAGDFISRDHGTTGRALTLELADGSRFLRFEDLATDNGPDLFVYLSTNAARGPEGAFEDDFVNLGRLKGNIGSQNYEIPPEVDLSRYTTVVIWCDRFSSAFGAADLVPAP